MKLYSKSPDHWSDKCKKLQTIESRRSFFRENKLCFNCGKKGHRGDKCLKRGCYFCKAKHHSSLCDKERDGNGSVLTGFTSSVEETLPPLLPVRIEGKVIWAFLDTGSGRNFISKDAMRILKLKPERFMIRDVTTINGTRQKAMPIFTVTIESLDKKAREAIEIAGVEINDFTTIRRLK